MLTREEVLIVLDLIRNKYGSGYAEDPAVGALQAKLSMMLRLLPEE